MSRRPGARHARPPAPLRLAARVAPAGGQLAAAGVLGAGAGAVALAGGWWAAAAVAALAAAVGLAMVGVERMAAAAWAATAATAPLSGVRVAGVAVSDVTLVAAVALTLPAFAAGARRHLASVDRSVHAGFALLATGGLVGTLFAERADVSIARMAAFLAAAAGSVAAVALWAPTRQRVARLCSWWLGGAVLNAVWALLVSPSVGGRRTGLSTHPNHLGIVCVLAIGLALGIALGGARRARALAAASLVPLGGALLLSGSRGALVGLAAVVPAVTAMSRRAQLAARALFLVGILAVALLAGLVDVPEQSGLGRLLGGPSAAESDVARGEHLTRSLDRVERHPLTGEGFEFAQEAHNIYLQALVAAGPVGLLGLALLARAVVRAGRRHAAAGAGPPAAAGDRALLAGLTGGYAAYLVVGAFQNALWDRYLWLYVAFALVLAAELRTDPRPGQGPATPTALASAGRREAR